MDGFTEFICEVEADLVNDGSICGKVYLTGAYNKFVNDKLLLRNTERKVPKMFEGMKLKQLELGELRSEEEMDDACLVYSYPFERRTPSKDGKVVHPYVSDTLCVQPIALRIEAYSKNLIGRSVLRNTFAVDALELENEQTSFKVLDLRGSDKQFTLRVGLSEVECMWVCYFEQI